MFFSTKLGFTISKFHRRISILAVYVKYWTINHFSHSYKRRHLLAIFSSNPSFWKFLFWGIPRFGNFHFEGSLVLEISILRDPSFQEFWYAWNKQFFFSEVLLSLSSQFLLLGSLYVHGTDILKRHRSWLAFFGCKDHWCKVPPLHRGHHRQLNK